MSPAQQPPFLICVPIKHSGAWPGLAARETEALLDQLGNPAGKAVRDAIDETKIVHNLSLAVVWDEASDDPPVLLAHLAGDDKPEAVIAALVEKAGALLLPVFHAAAGVETPDELQRLLNRYWIKPVTASLPLWPHRATGLGFQGTPGLTVTQILDDEKIAQRAQTFVDGRAAPFRSALSCVDAARKATECSLDPQGSLEPLRYLSTSFVPKSLWTATFDISALVVFDWSYLLVILFALSFLGMLDLFSPILAIGGTPSSDMLFAFPLAILFGFGINSIVRVASIVFEGRATPPNRGLAFLTFFATFVAAVFALAFSPILRRWLLPSFVPDAPIVPFARWVMSALRFPFAWWVTTVLSFLSLALSLALVAGLLVWWLRWEETHKDEPDDEDPDPQLVAELLRREDRPPHKQNHMISVATISPGFFRRFVSLPAGLYAAGLTVRAQLFKTGFLSNLRTIHFIQWARVPGTSKLVFVADYDGSWQSYLEDAITTLPTGATGIWSNTKGFPKTSWLFFEGADDGDRFKRFVRRTMIPTRFWYSAYPHLTTTDIRANAAIRSGLQSDALTPTDAETWLKLFGSAPRLVSEIETDQIQGLVLSGYRNLLEGALLTVSFPHHDPAVARRWLAEVVEQVDFGDSGQPESAMAVALSTRGLERLGLDESHPLAARFSPAFAIGMANKARANVLGDVHPHGPETWAWGGEDNPVDAALLIYAKDSPRLEARVRTEQQRCAQIGLGPPSEIRLGRWPEPRDQKTNAPIPITEPFGFVDGISQPAIRGLRSSRGAVAQDVLEPGEFILGYPDGREQFAPTPQVFASADIHGLLPDLPQNFPPQPNGKSVRDLGRNGSYLVIRQLKQDVAGFQQFVKDVAAAQRESEDFVGAKMVGRWKNGAPLVLFPQEPPKAYDPTRRDENFLFGRDDPQGLACPFGAHVRRANPRDQFDPGNQTEMSITNRHRILRRGRAYVDGDNSEAPPQGLLFMCLNADIERQFEFLQQTWIGSSSFGPLRGESDPVTAANRTDGTYTIPTHEGPPMRLTGMPSFVSVVGGGYFFLPGRQALKFLSGRGSESEAYASSKT
jgi:Dyp-type peroxidase family